MWDGLEFGTIAQNRKLMKVKPAPIVSSLILCTLGVFSTFPAHADKAAVQSAEASVKTFETRVGTSNPSYTGQLMYLAGIYQANGMRKEADVTFHKALDSCKQRADGQNEVPGLMLRWAMTLASPYSTVNKDNKAAQEEDRKAYETDLPKAEKILLDGLALANALPATSKERISYMLGTVSFYRVLERKPQEQARLKAVEDHLSALGKDEKLNNEEITEVAYNLVKLANLYCQVPPIHAMKMLPPVQVVSDDVPAKSNTVKSKDFKKAEELQLRAIAVYDRLPETVPWRIEAHRALVIWYRHFGQSKQEELQTQQLSKLMHTTDRSKLFPQPPPCPACGMG